MDLGSHMNWEEDAVGVENMRTPELLWTADAAVGVPERGSGWTYRWYQRSVRSRLRHTLETAHVVEGAVDVDAVAVVVVVRRTGCGSAAAQPETPLGRCRIGAG